MITSGEKNVKTMDVAAAGKFAGRVLSYRDETQF